MSYFFQNKSIHAIIIVTFVEFVKIEQDVPSYRFSDWAWMTDED